MTKILILGGGGMIGQKLAKQLLANDPDADITLHDIAFPPNGVPATQQTGDVSDPATMTAIAQAKFDTIYHLASIVSGEAEQQFRKGWVTNLHAMMNLLEGLRTVEHCPRIVFTSSIAVFGGPYPDVITDDYFQSPQTSYGAQKLACEVLLQDYSRKGYVDGLSLRLPTICVRPGKPNLAASSFFSGIIREPLNGVKAALPVVDSTRHWFASPKAAAGFLIHAAALDTEKLNGRRALNLPGVSCTVAEQIEALREIAGQKTIDLITPQPDPDIAKIVAGWPQNFTADRAIALGFKAEANFADIIKIYITEDMPKTA
ncbi:MAG: nucleoside-diphosphate-sugar epimerase [Yoonia sp.]|jgi:nucleoside-diphosphate-sugar epimerase